MHHYTLLINLSHLVEFRSMRIQLACRNVVVAEAVDLLDVWASTRHPVPQIPPSQMRMMTTTETMRKMIGMSRMTKTKGINLTEIHRKMRPRLNESNRPNFPLVCSWLSSTDCRRPRWIHNQVTFAGYPPPDSHHRIGYVLVPA